MPFTDCVTTGSARAATLSAVPSLCHRFRESRASSQPTQVYKRQSTATANAEQISRMRSSPNLPRRWVRVPIETLSTESRLTADRRGIGSSPGSSCTSLASPRIVVVHGAISALRSLGMATSRERTTTGRRAISGSSHHHTSPLAGRSFTTKRPRETTPSRPIGPTHRVDDRRKPCTRRRFRRHDAGQQARRELHQGGLRRSDLTSTASHAVSTSHRRSC